MAHVILIFRSRRRTCLSRLSHVVVRSSPLLDVLYVHYSVVCMNALALQGLIEQQPPDELTRRHVKSCFDYTNNWPIWNRIVDSSSLLTSRLRSYDHLNMESKVSSVPDSARDRSSFCLGLYCPAEDQQESAKIRNCSYELSQRTASYISPIIFEVHCGLGLQAIANSVEKWMGDQSNRDKYLKDDVYLTFAASLCGAATSSSRASPTSPLRTCPLSWKRPKGSLNCFSSFVAVCSGVLAIAPTGTRLTSSTSVGSICGSAHCQSQHSGPE